MREAKAREKLETPSSCPKSPLCYSSQWAFRLKSRGFITAMAVAADFHCAFPISAKLVILMVRLAKQDEGGITPRGENPQALSYSPESARENPQTENEYP